VVSKGESAEAALGNYHTHSRYDDGRGELEEYVLAALEKGMRYLGFSGHAPMALPTDWLMTEPNLLRYLQELRALRAKYADQISLLVGLEVDYLPGLSAPREPRIAALGLDYVLGSVHYLRAPAQGAGWTVDGGAQELDAGIAADFHGDTQAVVIEYYRRMAEMIRLSPPDIVGHFDLVKRNNRGELRFSEGSPWYREAVRGALDALAESSCVLEVNTGGLIRGSTDTVYPSPWILAECRERGIRVVVNADAHRPEHLDGFFAQAFALLREAGFRARMLLSADGWQERAL
jgi:histidinol-phosphatase (PHP family)